VPDPVGLPDREIIKALAGLRAFGEIMGIVPPQLDLILERAELEMRVKPSVPGPPGPPTPPPTP